LEVFSDIVETSNSEDLFKTYYSNDRQVFILLEGRKNSVKQFGRLDIAEYNVQHEIESHR